MGREIRMVPPNWEHPKWTEEDAPERHMIGWDKSMYDQHIDDALAEWLADFDRVRAGNMTDHEREWYPTFAEWLHEHSPPNPQHYRPWRTEEATWVQVWETVSEGTPVSPPFATRAELVDYLATNGDFWDQNRGRRGWDRAAAESFVNRGWAPSLMTVVGQAGAQIYEPRDGMPDDAGGNERSAVSEAEQLPSGGSSADASTNNTDGVSNV